MQRDLSTSFPTAFGTCTIAWSDRGISRLRLPDPESAEAAQKRHAVHHTLPSEIGECITLLQSYFTGAEVGFADVALDFGHIGAEVAPVYRALREVGWGEIITYGELAAAAGRPGTARAIGVAMARNPWPVIVPCHRVVAAGARIGGFSAPGGAQTKVRLLTLERVQAGNIQPLLPGLS